VAFVAILVPIRAEDSISPEAVTAVKKATTYLRVEGDGWTVSGSGFVVATDDKSALIATNYHVVVPTAPAGSRSLTKPVMITAVFDSGMSAERSAPATVAALDPELDLAVLRVAGFKESPRPVPYLDTPKPVETATVYSFGFPFGKALSTTKGNPAITVGKASVSSLRTGADGGLALIQIDGNLNPGNSGGPVVDEKGRLVGVAVATIKDGQGIGFVIPAADLSRVMAGRIGKVRVTPKKTDGSAHIEADLVDPSKKIRQAVARYVVVPPTGKRPTVLDAGSPRVELKPSGGVVAADVPLSATVGEILVQVTAETDEKLSYTTLVRAFPLDPKGDDYTGTPPTGWKEYNPRDKSFVLWVPETPDRQEDKERTVVVAKTQRIRVNSMVGRTAGGVTYQADSVVLPPQFIRAPRKDMLALAHDLLAAEVKGKLTETKKDEKNPWWGTEYRSESGDDVTRSRLIVGGSRIYIVRVTGSDAKVSAAEAETILYSYRVPLPAKTPADANPAPGAAPAAPETAKAAPKGKEPTILGGAFDPQFKDVAPDGALLVGLEIGLGKFGNRDMIRSARPIYRSPSGETNGEIHGTVKPTVTLKAKDGYAVGAVTVKHGMMFDGMSVTFMKVTDGKLDPADAYESEWVGTDEKKTPTKQGGDGTPVVGIVGKSSAKEMTGMGLLFKGQTFDPAKK
jgi:S1-C subfamily serine protease